jgi:hypothetical protein
MMLCFPSQRMFKGVINRAGRLAISQFLATQPDALLARSIPDTRQPKPFAGPAQQSLVDTFCGSPDICMLLPTRQ